MLRFEHSFVIVYPHTQFAVVLHTRHLQFGGHVIFEIVTANVKQLTVARFAETKT